ncbi:carbohydrate ABC transporter permease [Devosia rhodophyticola]|uniref:sn-glycerol-3-phosphate transport system permease protein UgpE n=1 Tax=Devosia rhodophyticola TaxID=3026423 RepID=A0ABY7YZD6_9HYPH|nr:carbohydrate ABC transporter permease [Devosia rhodophyticola]WDR06249.1 carbohydrate ABC transporter permease [Devosia rhodophyticola]
MSATATTYYDRKGIIGTLGRDGLLQIILVANTFIMLAPIVIMVFSAFKTNMEIFQSPFALPDFGNVGNFVKIWTQTNFIRYLLNSFLVTGSSMVLILTLGTMAAYAIARYQFFGASFILMFFIAGLTLPLKLAIIPLFMLMRDIGILNNQLSLIFVYTAMGLPTTVFIMTGFIRTLPNELEDAARMDGASEARDHVVGDVATGASRHGYRGHSECGTDLERLFLSAGVYSERQSQNPAAGPDDFHGRI